LNFSWQQKTFTYSIKRSRLSSSDHQFASLFAPILVVLWRAGGELLMYGIGKQSRSSQKLSESFVESQVGAIASNNDEKLKGLRDVEFEPQDNNLTCESLFIAIPL